jgi:hypothetical protein
MMDLLEVAAENPRSRAPPGPNLDDLLGLELIEKYESPYLPVFTLGLRHVEVELSNLGAADA